VSATNKPIEKRMVTLKEHAAGVKAAAAWQQELIAAHLVKGDIAANEPTPPAAS
jgi:hypothetical protein